MTSRLRSVALIMFALAAASVPLLVHAAHQPGHIDPPSQGTGFLREGVFGCSAGRYPLDVAALSAVRGVYVPVNDAAVTLNTGYLVYKECVLDGVVAATREAATGAMVRSILTSANRGRNGQPQYVKNPRLELRERADAEMIEYLEQYDFRDVCTPYRTRVRAAVANTYYQETRDPQRTFRCSVQPQDIAAYQQGAFLGWENFAELVMNPSNNELASFYFSGADAMGRTRDEVSSLSRQWEWADGWYPRQERVCNTTSTGQTVCEWETLTPGNVINQIVGQAVTSGFRQLENADEIDQVINSLFSGLTNQIMGDVRGFAGLTEVRLGQAPYLDQLSSAASGRLRDSAINTGLSRLNVFIAIEQEFNAAQRAIKALLEQASARLIEEERKCWVEVEAAVRARAAQGNCTGPSDPENPCNSTPIPIRVSTSTPRITGGTVALRMGPVTLQNGTAFALSAPQSTLIESSTLNVTANAATTTTGQQDIGLPLSAAIAPGAGQQVTLTTSATAPFGAGTLTVRLRPGQTLPQGDVRFALNAISPFLQAGVSLIVGLQSQFSDSVISEQITPNIALADQAINASNQGLSRLLEIANDLRNTTSGAAQTIALQRLDTLIAQHLIHTAQDLTNAETRRTDVERLAQQIVEDTVNSWRTGGGWCNVSNPNVVQEWLNRWRI